MSTTFNLSRRRFVGSLAAACAGPYALWAVETPIIKIGAISDTHVRKGDGQSALALQKAFRRFAAEGVRAVVISGDICHQGTLDELEIVMDAWRQVFPGGKTLSGEKVEPFFVFGNHDYHASGLLHAGKATTDEDRRNGILFNKDAAWRMITGGERFPGEIVRRDIGGVVFIGAHWSHEAEVAPWLAAHAQELPRDRPVIYVQHPHPKGTCFGKWTSSDRGENHDALMRWPNLFAISGHSHVSVSYDDALWMGGFCSMGAGSTCRTQARRYEYDAALSKMAVKRGTTRHMPAVSHGGGWQSSVLSIYPSRIIVSRWEHRHDERLGEDWNIPFPFRHDPASPYRLAASAPAPEFPSGAGIEVSETDGFLYPAKTPERQLRLSFPAAKSVGAYGRVIDYRVEVVDESTGRTVAERLVQQEWATLAESRALTRKGWCAFGRDELPAGARLAFRVTPINAGGKGGRPLTGRFTA